MKKIHDYIHHYRGYWSDGVNAAFGSIERTVSPPW